MIELPSLDKYRRSDLIEWVAETCVPVSSFSIDKRVWLFHTFGDDRPGDIFQEAMEGHIDYFDGDWQFLPNPFDPPNYVLWFSTKSQLTEYVLTWA